MAEFGQYRIQDTIAAGAISRYALPVPYNRVWFIYRYKFGNITVNVLNFRWNSTRCARETTVLLGTEHTNFDNRPFPYLIAKGTSGQVVVTNTAATAQVFEMTISYCQIDETMIKPLEKIMNWEFKV